MGSRTAPSGMERLGQVAPSPSERYLNKVVCSYCWSLGIGGLGQQSPFLPALRERKPRSPWLHQSPPTCVRVPWVI